VIDLSIVVVTWNTRELVIECLASVERELHALATGRGEECGLEGSRGLSVETWVVDNGSEDGTAEAIAERFSWVRLLRLPRNLGFAAGSNRGLARVAGRHSLLLNSDTELVRGALELCVRFLDEHPDVGIVGPQLLHPDGSKQNSVHNFPVLATELLPKGLLQLLFRRRFPSWRWAGSDPLDVEAVVGAAVFLRTELLESVGPLPEDYFFFLEETDWCWRVRQAGWRIVYLTTAYVVHVSGASSKRKDPALTRIEYHRSLYRFFRKNRGRGRMTIVFVLRIVKSLFYVLSQAPLALMGERQRARWVVHRDVLLWHLRGCPASVGLARALQAEARR
jgi:GT2 family glycosyltransferase